MSRRRGWLGATILIAALGSGCAADLPEGWTDAPERPYEPARLRDATDRLGEWVAENDPAAAEALRPGLPPTESAARAAAEGCPLPREVAELLQWHDGMRSDTDVPLIWYHRLMSLEESLEERGIYGPTAPIPSPLPEDWLPLFEFQGEYYFTRCQSDNPQAPVWHWSGEEPEVRRVFASLTRMLETALDWYEEGAVWVADPETGALDQDLPRVRSIYLEHNPEGTFPYYVPEGDG